MEREEVEPEVEIERRKVDVRVGEERRDVRMEGNGAASSTATSFELALLVQLSCVKLVLGDAFDPFASERSARSEARMGNVMYGLGVTCGLSQGRRRVGTVLRGVGIARPRVVREWGAMGWLVRSEGYFMCDGALYNGGCCSSCVSMCSWDSSSFLGRVSSATSCSRSCASCDTSWVSLSTSSMLELETCSSVLLRGL